MSKKKMWCKDCCYWVVCRPDYGAEWLNPLACKDYSKKKKAKCEITPKKPKMVRVKAWAYIGATTKTICVSTTEPFCMSVPCFAVIKAKDAKALTEMMEGK